MSGPLEQLQVKGKLWIAIILIFNILSSVIFIILYKPCSSAYPLYPIQKQSYNLRKKFDEIYNTVKKAPDFCPTTNRRGEKEKLEILNLLKPLSQLSGLDFDHNKEDNIKSKHPTVIRNWSNNRGFVRHLLWNDMLYQNGSISVPVNGLYHVRSHVIFHVKDRKEGPPDKHVQHKILRYNALNGKQVLVASSIGSEYSKDIIDGVHLEYPSYLGCLVQLNPGDQLSVAVSNVDLLKPDRDWHSFGVYLI